MTAYVAFLRAINLPRHGKVGMADLRHLFVDLGFESVETVLQTGNVIFEAQTASGAELEARLESESKKRLRLETDFIVRTAAELADAVAQNPFPEEAQSDPGHLVVMFAKAAPSEVAVEALQASIKGQEVVRAGGRHVYAVYPDGIGRSKLTNVMIERALGTRVTGRNWNTVLKLAALTGASR